jgi:crotonobetainyl-CoA:carnitine CoA-transferase CaiB-like acyl-CoA transferase
MSETPIRFDPIPHLGQDTEAILHELGYTAAEIEAFRQDEVI